MPLSNFHPAVSRWFLSEFKKPTEVQQLAWAQTSHQKNTLIAAPTGSGKTLAAFLAAIDGLIRKCLTGELDDKTQVVYVSPLKALSNDIEKNLQQPLAGINRELKHLGLSDCKIRAAVRTGDTPAYARTQMVKKPPHILVTTPESLYLLLTSDGGRSMLSNANTLIVDEIHAVVNSKRGSHLSLTMDRLQNLVKGKLARIGLSATQKPIEEIAHFLVGEGNCPKPGQPNCEIVNVGHQRNWDVAIEIPDTPLGAVMANEVWEEVYLKLEDLVKQHRTTLIFVNTRRLAERAAAQLSTRLGEEFVAAHHGSLSREQRFDAEQRLKEGSLKVLVATASLELGIDIGSVDLVCQVSSPRSISAFLQRIGRSGHQVGGTPKGRVFPLSRDDLIECVALFEAVKKGELDQLIIPQKPIDILCQHMVASVACDDWREPALFRMVKRSYSFRDLSKQEFTDTIDMLSKGFTLRSGRKRAYIQRDVINKRLKARKGARLTALTSGGAIPDSFDYDVRLEPSNTFIGSVNEDFAIESMTGDIFQLGNTSWQIMKIENGTVRVLDAKGANPTIPFWFGEAPERTAELSQAVSRLRTELFTRMIKSSDANAKVPDEEKILFDNREAISYLLEEVGVSEIVANQVVFYLFASKLALNEMPSQDTLVLERFFDEAGDMHLVVHSPFGSRLNRAWGLALRKQFCRQFNFELQAAANDNAIVLSLGSTHSFPLQDVFNYLKPATARDKLIQAVFDSPMFEIRWRWNATRSLAILRMNGGKRVPANLQRMFAEDLISLVFPDQLA